MQLSQDNVIIISLHKHFHQMLRHNVKNTQYNMHTNEDVQQKSS